jgi:Tol biopolymer transport system component
MCIRDSPYQALGTGKIVFDRINDPGGSGLYVIDIDKRKSYGFRLNSLTRWPYISPDGTKIACSLLNSADWNSTWNIYCMNIDGTNCFQVSHSGNERYPTWTPDGLKILFYLNNSEGPLYMQSAKENSTDKVELTRFYYGDDPYWAIVPSGGFSMSPTGKLVCASNGAPKTSGILHIEPYVGKSGVTTLVPLINNQWLESPVFSPDGTKIAFVTLESDTLGNQLAVSVKSMNPDGTNLTQLVRVKTYNAAISWMGYTRVGSLCWSPDGKKILFTALNKQGGGYHLMVINADGSGLTRVTDEMNAYDYDVSWGR